MSQTIRLLLLIATVFAFRIDDVSAFEVCAGGYERSERSLVVSIHPQAQPVLNRLAELAESSAWPYYSQTQRLALNQEYQALLSILGTMEFSNFDSLTTRGANFVRTVVNSHYLDIGNTAVHGATAEESISLARAALDAINQASTKMQLCLYGSWDRVSYSNSTDNRVCVGGYAPRNFEEIQVNTFNVSRVLFKLYEMAETASTDLTSSTTRQLSSFDYQYLMEEIELIGEVLRPELPKRTRNYIKQVFDPHFLGIKNTTVGGDTVNESQQNSLAATIALKDAIQDITKCLWRRK